MRTFFTLCLLCAFASATKAQTPAPQIPKTEEYGKVSQEDLDLKTCDFEKDANAMVLFDKGNMYMDGEVGVLQRHTRIKVLNDFGKGAGDRRIEYYTYMRSSAITDLQAQTINFENGKMQITPLDKKLVYSEVIDKTHTAMVFAMPNVKAGSIIEIKYRYALNNGYFPNWYFQSSIPTRYSEIKMDMPISNANMTVRIMPHVKQDFVINVGQTGDHVQDKALANVHSLPDEPFMGARNDNLQRVEYFGMTKFLDSWKKIGDLLVKYEGWGAQLNRGLSNEGPIIKQARSLKTDDEKIAYIFNQVKNSMKWNDIHDSFPGEGVQNAWDKKTGNSAEINMMVYHLLKKTGVKAYPMLVGTKQNARINPFYPNVNILNNMVVCVRPDSTRNYILDATDKYGLYNTIPTEDLNTFGLRIDEDNMDHKTVFLEDTDPVIQSVFLNAEITPDGKMSGPVQISSAAYNKSNVVKKYKTDGEEKYIDFLRSKDNNVKISALKLDNMEVDSLPLAQTFNFTAGLSGTDDKYLYFNTNLFLGMGPNPFTTETRFSDIDFGYMDNYSGNGIYKLPAGFIVGTLPKPVNVVMPDGSLVFRRVVAENEGTVTVRYVLLHKKTLLYVDSYDALHDFYKQMYELLNEPIVLKKS